MNSPSVEYISESYIKPKYEVNESQQPYHLTPWDLAMLSTPYIQYGLLFKKPSILSDDHKCYSTIKLLSSLKSSLSLALVHFYPLAGQFVTQTNEEDHECLVYIDCNKGPGARFIHAAALDVTISDILSPTDVPPVVDSFFDHNLAVNHDGHNSPLLSVQVTELLDGIFIGCTINHAVTDGTSYWHFWNVWSQIHRASSTRGDQSSLKSRGLMSDIYAFVSRPCVQETPSIPLPFTRPDEFVIRPSETVALPQLRDRFFHFSSESIAKLKSKANKESNTNKISSFQALSALVWRAIVRAIRLPHDQVTKCTFVINNRNRLDPPLPEHYFGNAISGTKTETTAGELIQHALGWAALLLHQSVVNYTDKTVRDFLQGWVESPVVYQIDELFEFGSVSFGGSPRFDVYGNEFGLGKALAVRSGPAFKHEGYITAHPGYEGEGSVDLEICLPSDSMHALESDEEFIGAVSQ